MNGIPGCGKTALCSAIIDKHKEDALNVSNAAPIAYFYCKASRSEPERRSAEGVVRSFVRQLCLLTSPQFSIHSAVLSLYDKKVEEAKKEGFEIASLKIFECVELILAALESNPATLIIDALDELDDPKRLVDALDAMLQKSRNVVNILVTARDKPALSAMLSSAQKVRITSVDNQADVERYATEAVNSAVSDRKLLTGNVTQDLTMELIDALTSTAGEMFLWIKLQLVRLC